MIEVEIKGDVMSAVPIEFIVTDIDGEGKSQSSRLHFLQNFRCILIIYVFVKL